MDVVSSSTQVILDSMSLDDCLEAFRKTDCIMEPSVIQFLTRYIEKGGTPEIAIKELSKSYLSLAQMVNLLADWMVQLGLEPAKIQDLIENHYYNLVIKYFDPKKADKIFNVEGKIPDWLGGLVENQKWRKLIYQLAEEYPDCLMLTFTVKLIAESGFQGEITGVATASQQLEVFAGVLNTEIMNIVNEKSSAIQHHIKELCSMVNYGEHSFLFSIILLSYLEESPYGGSMAYRIKQEIIKSSSGSENLTDIIAINFAVSKTQMHPRALHAMSSMLSKNQLNPADITILYKLYQVGHDESAVPTVSLLKDPIFLELLVACVFCKEPKINTDHKAKYIYLLAYAVSVVEDWKYCKSDGSYRRTSIDTEDLQSTLVAIDRVNEVLWNKGSGRELVQEVELVHECIRVPVVAFGITNWVEEIVQDDSFYDRTTDPIPVPLLLLDEVITVHQLQHEHVFQLLKKLFLHSFSFLSTHAKLEMEKVIADRMIHLVCNDFVIPVIQFFADCLKNLNSDTSVIRYFLSMLLDLIGAPFSDEFVIAIQPLCIDDSLIHAVQSKANENLDIQALFDRIETI
ncbi:negative elongation factor D-like [Symsagittifera roscoffensis]|uniref:negative elongation factor D-like n=1 Tax=Symsagittifera roscoffensis TaxID=84072 RepID=UPI00307C76C9